MDVQSPIEMHRWEVREPRFHMLPAPPSNPPPVEGMYWWDAVAHTISYYDGTTVQTVPLSGGAATAYAAMTDGTTTASAAVAGTFLYRVTGVGLGVAVQDNDGTYGDNLNITIDSAVSGNNKVLLTGPTGKVAAAVVQEVIALGDLTDVAGKTGAGTTAVMADTPTIVTPTIASFTNANHNHLNAAGGGTITAAAVSNFDTQVRTSRLDQFAAAGGDVSLGGFKLTNGATPVSGTDYATKAYVDAVLQGQDQKPTATVATTAALPASTYANGTSGVGATLTGNANGALVVDTLAVAAGQRVVVRNQAAPEQNGLYAVTQPGTGGTPFILTRDPSMDTAGEFAGAFIPVEDAGTANANSLWLCTNTADPVVGTTAITFTQLNKGTDLAGTSSITVSGNAVSINATYAGQASIVTVGALTGGSLAAGFTVVALALGGLGVDASTAAGATTARDTTHLGRPPAAPANATAVVATARGVTLKASFVLTHDGSRTQFTCTHNLNTQDVTVQVWDNASPRAVVIVDTKGVDANNVRIDFGGALANGTVFNVVVVG